MKKFILSTVLFATLLINNSCSDEEISVSPNTSRKLDYYIESYQLSDLGFEPQMKVVYEYDDSGKLSKYTVFGYNPASNALEELRHFDFTYIDGKVDKIKVFLVNAETPDIEDSYEYLTNGKISKITEKNFAAGVNSDVNFNYDEANKIVANYTFSNGGSFQYEISSISGNIVSDKTTNGSELCNNGTYTYDAKVNPFSKLGYIDYSISNFSENNKLTESVNYVGCAFPSLVAESYSYEYDDAGYPTLATTIYKNKAGKSQRKFYYK
jgi:hypothetical protein